MSALRPSLTSGRSNLVAGGIVMVLTAVLGWSFLVGPATAELAETRSDLVDTTDANQLLTVRLHGLERQRDELDTTVGQADDLAVAFPPTADQPGFFRMVDEAASAAGIRPGQVTALSPTAPLPAMAEDGTAAPDPAAPAAPVDGASLLAVQTVVVNVEAPYDALQRLLENLEEMDRAFLVQETLLTNDEAGTSVQITGATYVAPPLSAPDADELGGSPSGGDDDGTRAGGKP